jgi:hypothetical protein
VSVPLCEHRHSVGHTYVKPGERKTSWCNGPWHEFGSPDCLVMGAHSHPGVTLKSINEPSRSALPTITRNVRFELEIILASSKQALPGLSDPDIRANYEADIACVEALLRLDSLTVRSQRSLTSTEAALT